MSQAMGKIIGHVVRALAVDLPDVADGDLLSRYIASRDADAFAALVRRHGPMVRGVCRRILRHDHDAEDAFQATFLVLVRKAKTIKPKAVVGNWLYGVAYHTAVRARAIAAKRRGREAKVAELVASVVTIDNQELSDILPLLDKKLNALPDKYRAPIVLCDLEGLTRKEAAHQLGWPEGTVAGRLARGRAILAKRLGKMIGTLSVVLSSEVCACVPLPLVEATLRAASMYAAGSAAAVISGPVVALTQGVLNAMFLTKLKTAVAGLLIVAVCGVGTGGLLYNTQAADPQVAENQNASQINPPPLPAGNQDVRNPLAKVEGQPKTDNLLPPNPGAFEPPTYEQLRTKYVKLQEDLSRHLSAVQLKQRADDLEKELAAAKDREQRLAREKSAADELEKAKAILVKVATQHQGTAAATKAQEALRLIQGSGAGSLPRLPQAPAGFINPDPSKDNLPPTLPTQPKN